MNRRTSSINRPLTENPAEFWFSAPRLGGAGSHPYHYITATFFRNNSVKRYFTTDSDRLDLFVYNTTLESFFRSTVSLIIMRMLGVRELRLIDDLLNPDTSFFSCFTPTFLLLTWMLWTVCLIFSHVWLMFLNPDIKILTVQRFWLKVHWLHWVWKCPALLF